MPWTTFFKKVKGVGPFTEMVTRMTGLKKLRVKKHKTLS